MLLLMKNNLSNHQKLKYIYILENYVSNIFSIHNLAKLKVIFHKKKEMVNANFLNAKVTKIRIRTTGMILKLKMCIHKRKDFTQLPYLKKV